MIHCAICLNQGSKTEAATTIKGYSVCEDHAELVSRPDFDIFHLRAESRVRPV